MVFAVFPHFKVTSRHCGIINPKSRRDVRENPIDSNQKTDLKTGKFAINNKMAKVALRLVP
jgi:hypothetical protein